MIRRTFNLLLIAVVVGAVTMYAAAASSLATLVLGLAGVAVGLVLGRVRGSATIPVLAVVALVSAVIGLTALRALNRGFSVELFCEFIVMLLVVKLFDRRRARDDAQVLTLAVFLCIGAALTSNTLLVGVLLAVMLVLTAGAVICYQAHAASERAHRPADALTGTRPFRDFGRLISGTVVLTAIGSVCVFLIVPRGLGRQAFGSWGEAGAGAQIGFDDEIQLGTVGMLSESQTPVMDVQFVDNNGGQLGALGRVFYLRGAVLDRYRDRVWQSSREPSPVGDGDLVEPGTWWRVGANDPKEDWDIEQRVTIRNAPRDRRGSALFAINEPMFISFGQQTICRITPNTNTISRFEPSGKFSYAVRSKLRAFERPIGPNVIDRRGPISPTPEVYPPSVKALTEQVLTDAGIEPDPSKRSVAADVDAARAIERYLQSEGGFHYSLTPPVPGPSVDPIEAFLFASKEGHCEYFAAAMAIMCRSVGVHARVVTGYVAAEYNDLTDHYIVRESNAHAWVEILVARDATSPTRFGLGAIERWRAFDPTPRADFQSLHQKPESLWSGVRRAIEAVQFAWVTHVVGYNAGAQRNIFGDAGITESVTDLDRRLADRMSRGHRPLVMRAAAVGVTVFAFALLLGMGVASSRLRWRPWLLRVRGWSARRRSSTPDADPLASYPEFRAGYDAATRLLAHLEPDADAAPLRTRVERAGPALAPDALAAARRITERVYALVYAGAEPSVPELARAREDAAVLRAAARAARAR